MSQQHRLGEFEELLLLAILKLGDNAYGVTLQEVLEGAGRDAALGAIYVTLERLEKKGYVSNREGAATAERGGRTKKLYRVEGAGQTALNEQERARLALRGAFRPQFVRGGA